MVAKRTVWAFCLALCAPLGAHALGLGDIRLSSALNQTLAAEIELVNAAPEELADLKASLASRETFARYGLDYPNFLSTVTLTRGKSASGRDVLKLTSAETITEPFVSLLVEVNWGRGRLVREYTVLLDPPVFAPNTPPVAAAAPPSTGSATSGTIVRSAPAPEPAPEAVPDEQAGGQTYVVRQGDSLSSIAGRLADSAGAGRDQLMLGLYRANPEAFEGTMNQLRAGAILRMPERSALQAISVADASSEVQRQYASWRAGAGAAGGGEGRLRLVAPGEAGASGSGATADEVRSLRDRLSQLEGELAESKRLLELRNAELATLQRQLAGQGGVQPSQEPAAGAATAPPQPAEAPATAGAEQPATATTPTPAEAPPPGEAEAPPAPAVELPMRPRIRTEAPADTGPSFLDSIFDVLRDYGLILAGVVVVLLGGFFGMRKFQERRAAQDTLAASSGSGFASAELGTDLASPAPPARRVEAPAARSEMLVEESHDGEPAAPRSRAPAMVETEPSSTLSGDTAVNLDQGDPLAEADFHMAYGLYDQAADLVRGAIQREPERLDLKLKLVEVFFVWGNKDEFLRQARELHQSGLAAGSGDWDKIVIMGRQIAPEEPLFSQGSGALLGKGGVDLDLAGGDSRVDLDLSAEPAGENIDLDLGSAAPAVAAAHDTVSMPVDRDGLDATQQVGEMTISLDGPGMGGTTRQMVPDLASTAAIDLDLGGLGGVSDTPTVEQPVLRSGAAPTIREKIDMAARAGSAGDESEVERTSEVAIDDLGLDIGSVEGLDLADEAGSEVSSDAATLVAGLDEQSRRIFNEAAERRDMGATASLASLDGAGDHDLDFDLGSAEDKTVERPMMRGNGSGAADHGFDLSLDSTAARKEAVGAETVIADDLSLPPLEPVTMSEVGTKLDLARAYVDMGDPDGARNILQEVLQEGSMSQKQEAQRLLDSIPG